MKLPNPKNLQKWKPHPLLVAFLIPFGMMLMLMIIRGVTPFGNRMMLYSDEWHQYFPFFKAYSLALRSGDSLLFNWNVGMGMDYLGLISYYLASPLYLLSVLLPESWLLPYFSLLLPVKLGLASLFFAIFLKKLFGKKDMSIAVFGGFYGLCAWALGYQWNIMWLDTFALLPLVALGTISLLREKKFILYTITLACSILFNYYIGFFTCIFVLILFICYQISYCKGVKAFFLDLLRIAGFSVLAICMTAVLSLPALSALGKTYSSVNTYPDHFSLNIVNYQAYRDAYDAWEAFKAAKEAGEPAFGLWFEAMGVSIPHVLNGMGQVAGNMSGGLQPSFMEGLPNVYSGVSTLFLSFLFLMAGKVRLRERICCIVVLLFLMASCVIRQLDYVWHGFHFPNMIYHRFSFIFSFVMLYMAYRAYLERHRFKIAHFVLAAVLTVEMFLLSGFAKSIPAAVGSIGQVLSYIVRTIAGVASGNSAATNTALTGLKGLYDTYAGTYIFLLYNGIFFLAYFIILLLPSLHGRVAKKETWEEKKALAVTIRKRRQVTTIVLLAVMAFELVANVANFERHYRYTNTNHYPQGTEYTASMIRYMKEREDSLFYRTETTYTQTLNDGALNDYYGLSAFTSSANVTTTRFMTALGFAAQDNWNRYCYENGSPVANLFLNLKYMLERNGEMPENAYFDLVHYYGDTYLYENNAYLPLGFLAQSNLGRVELEMSSTNAFYNQNLLFSAATGIVDDVWERTPAAWRSIRGEGVEVTVTSPDGDCYYTTSTGGTVIYSYTVGADGFLSMDIDFPARNSFSVIKNNEVLFSDAIVLPQNYAISQVKEGDVVEVHITCAAGETQNMQIQAAMLKEDIFREGYEILNASTLQLTEFSNTRIGGTISCNRRGLLYTSVPNDGNWKAYVDGKEVEIVPVVDAMIGVEMTEGTHTVQLRYVNSSHTYGTIITVLSILIFLGLIYLSDRARWNERAVKLWNKCRNFVKKK